MTCQECEIKLGMGENADDHLASCVECRWLAQELRLNSLALREMRVRPKMYWALAAAAAIILMAIFLRMPRVQQLPSPVHVAVSAPQIKLPPVKVKHVHKKRVPAETLRVKMFTSDPDVVIYWIVDKKEGYE
jgi:hypothetical protein